MIDAQLSRFFRPQRFFAWSLAVMLSAAAATPNAFAAPRPSAAAPTEIVVDTVVASVNEKPITLRDVEERVGSGALTIKQAAEDPQVRRAVDLLIFERLVEAEAAARKIAVTDGEVDRYVEEIAKRNNLSVDGFKSALAAEKRDFTEYRRQIRLDIIRTRLTAAVVQSGVAVTQAEVEQYLSEHPELSRSGAKLKLRQIFIDGSRHTASEAERSLEAARARIAAGEDFRAVAAAVSESPDKTDGGLLGVVAEKDLSAEIFDAVFALKTGEVSPITRTPQGYHLFWVDERFDAADSAEAERLMDDVKRTLLEQKNRSRIDAYFSTELYKTHSVDRKI